MAEKSWPKIINKLQDLKINHSFDLIVAIARGGIVPAYLIGQKLGLDFEILWLKYRDEQNNIIYQSPQLLKEVNFSFKDKNILLADDVSKTGASFKAAKKHLSAAKKLKTFAINGSADFALYNEKCFKFPWTY